MTISPPTLSMKKPALWLLISKWDHPEIAYVIPTLAWMAGDSGALLENYLESVRDGRLFAETGSTILGGHHHQQFNYLCARFDVQIIRLGKSQVFESSIQAFGLRVLAESKHAAGLYAAMMAIHPALKPAGNFHGPSKSMKTRDGEIRIAPYLFPEILHRRALGFSVPAKSQRGRLKTSAGSLPILMPPTPTSCPTTRWWRCGDPW